MKDQAADGVNGSFLGWSLTLWGECIDDSKAKLWTFPPEELGEVVELPPADDTTSPTTASASTTVTISASESIKTARPKPTEGLPDDHHTASGDTENPAFSNPASASISSITTTSTKPTPSPPSLSTPIVTPSATLDEGYFDHIGDLLNSSTWLIAAGVLVAIFAIAGGLFFWRRRVRRIAAYSGLPGGGGGDDMALGAVDGSSRRLLGGGRKGDGRSPGGTKQLYDALAEGSDDEEDDGHLPSSSDHPGLRYHDDFLEDDQPDSTPHSPRAGGYRDDDGSPARKSALLGAGSEKGTDRRNPPDSPSGGSGDSWEHASEDPVLGR